MAFQSRLITDRSRLSAAIRRLAGQALKPDAMTGADIASAETELSSLRARLSEVEAALEQETDLRRPADAEISRPDQCDWAWRPDPFRHQILPGGLVAPESGTALRDGVTLFHDAPRPELTLRQIADPHGTPARFGLALEVYEFGGSFLSLVFDLPGAAVTGLTLGHYLALDLTLDLEAPLELFGRLNIQHGPNTETLVREMPIAGGHALAEFDLAYSRVNDRRIERAWLDLILEGPRMNRVELRDMTMVRAPRAEF